jgi:uncharacterized membrane protein YoaK (UPF0700 family)
MRWDNRWAFVLGLTATAGTLDALAFLVLGKVFNSFQSGNVLFIGLALGEGNHGLLVRAVAVVAAFVIGAAGAARLIGASINPRGVAIELRIVSVEVVLLAVFAALWLAVGASGGSPAMHVVLLAIGACAMGVQASLSLALQIPYVMTVALTATLGGVAQRLGLRGGADAEPARQAGTGLMLTLIGTYAACALVVAVLPRSAWVALLPVALLVTGVLVDVGVTLPRLARGGERVGSGA